MANIKVKIDLLQQQIAANNFKYQINRSGVPVPYTGGSASLVTKTFVSSALVSSLGISKTSVDNGAPVPWNYLSFLDPTDAAATVFCVTPAIVNGEQKYYVGGFFQSWGGNTNFRHLVRINANGSIDTTFSTAVMPLFFSTSAVYDIKVLTDGRILVGGRYYGGNNPINKFGGVVLLNTDGSINNRFGLQTARDGDVTASTAAVQAVDFLEYSNGDIRIWVGGQFNQYYNPTSNQYISAPYCIEILYRSNGVNNLYVPSTFSGGVYAFHIDKPNNSIYIGGAFSSDGTTQSRVQKRTIPAINVLSVSTKVAGFSPSINSTVFDMKQNSGGLIIGGYFTTVGGQPRAGIARLNINTGLLDTSFGNQNILATGLDPEIDCIHVGADEKITIGGYFTSVNGNLANCIARLNPNGGYDSTFSTNFNNTEALGYFKQLTAGFPYVFTIAGVGASDIVVGGRFDTFKVKGVQGVNQVPIGNTVQESALNLLENLQTYNINENIDYSIDPTDDTAVLVVYNFPSNVNVVVNNIQQVPNYVLISTSEVETAPKTILARSPYFVTTPFTGNVNTCKYELKLYNGNFVDDEPASPTYNITKTKIRQDQNIFYFDASFLTRDFLQVNIDSYISQNALIRDVDINETVWMSLKSTLINADGSIGTSNTVKYLAVDGFGYPEEGVNPPLPSVLMTNNVVDLYSTPIPSFLPINYVYPNNNRVYFNVEDLVSITRVTTNMSTGIVTTTTYTPDRDTNESNQLISSIRVPAGMSKVVLTFNYAVRSKNRTITFNFNDECRYDVKELYFKNRYGFLQTMSFTKRNSRALNVDRKTFNRSILNNNATFNSKKHTTVTYLVEATEEYTLNTDYLKEYMNDVYQEMLLSDEIYMLDDGIIKPVNILESTPWEVKQSNNDRLIQYTLRVSVAQNKINNIR